jgi:16S rRNA (cytidine1402-2'-O)-methyltransferase
MLIRSRAVTGTLFVVSTPIGNLGDMTFRAKEVLQSVDLIACEDTRVTRKLLRHYEIATRTLSYHEHNEAVRTPKLVERLAAGENIALVSDAGTPLVSDPGYRLVSAAREAGMLVRPVPGASALLAALSVAGLPTSSFTFVGFVPRKGGARRKALEALQDAPGTLVLYEAPGRVTKLLTDLEVLLGPRSACILREMTKLHEEHKAETLGQLAEWAQGRRFKGELTIVVSGERYDEAAPPVAVKSLAPRFAELRADGLSPRDAAKKLAKEHGLSTRDIYNELATHRR